MSLLAKRNLNVYCFSSIYVFSYLLSPWFATKFLTLADLQNVNITLRILFRPVTAQLPRIFTSIGEDYDERVLPSITTEILKSVVVRTVKTCWALRVISQLENLPSSLGSNSQSFSLSLHVLGQLRVCQPGENGINSGAHGCTDRPGTDNLSLLEPPSHCCLS